MINLMYFALLGSAMVFISLSHPIGLGLVLIVHTLLVSAATGLIGGHFWFSYVLFLVFLGGVLVLFIYMTSLASNEKFTVTWGSLIILIVVTTFIAIGVCMSFLPPSEPTSLVPVWHPLTFWPDALGILVSKLYSGESFKVTALLVFYLLYALLACANIVNKYSGALRNFN